MTPWAWRKGANVHKGNAGVICGEGMVEGNILGPRGRRLRREADASASGDRVATMTVLVALLSELLSRELAGAAKAAAKPRLRASKRA